jgi:hypothetical protein
MLLRGSRNALSAVPAWIWLAGIVGVSTVDLALESLALQMPIVFRDELVYSNAAKRLAAGLPPGFDGSSYGYGLIYPLFLAPFYRLFAHTDDAYTAIKVANAAVFSLAAVPAYLFARRVARPGLALCVALLTVLLPARTYTELVLTESLAFLIFLLAVLAIVRVLERPEIRRQLVMLGLCLVAFETRRQFVLLVFAIPVMFVGESLVEGGPPGAVARRVVSRYSATWIALTLGVVGVVVWSASRGADLTAGLGPYSVLAHGYEPADVARWMAYHAGAYGLTLAVIPLIALPFGLRICLGHDAPVPCRAVGVATLVLVPVFLLQVAAFSSTLYGLHRIHERYLFYVAPLVFAVLACWVDAGLPRARSISGFLVAASVIALPLLLPFSGLPVYPVDAPVLRTIGYTLDTTKTATLGSVFLLAIATSAFLAIWVFLVRRRYGFVLLIVVALAFLPADLAVRKEFVRDGTRWQQLATGGLTDLPRDWLDRTLGKGTPVAVLFVATSPACSSRRADIARMVAVQWRTTFFNSGIERLITVGRGPDVGVPIQGAAVDETGRVVVGTRPIVARYLVTDARLRLTGRQIEVDRATRLSLWETQGVVRALRVPANGALGELVCSGGVTTGSSASTVSPGS